MPDSFKRAQRVLYQAQLARIRWPLPGQRYEIILDSDPDPLVVHESKLTAAPDDEVPRYAEVALP